MKRSKLKVFSFLLQLAVTTSVFLGTSTSVKAAETKTFTVLTYNVAGLPEPLSSSKPATNTPLISPILNGYDIIAVQEDFAYHNQLIKSVTHPYLTPTSGSVPGGDGMNFISKYPLYDYDRETWNKRSGVFDNGSDQLTPKGFMYAQYQLEPGVYVDIYTLHTDAGDDASSYAARCDNMTQIANYIKTYSNGNAVIVMGDTNSRYTRKQDNFETTLMQQCGLRDPWIDIIRKGSVPADGDALMDASNKNGPNYEVVDKVLYRSSKSVTLNALSYRIEDTKFVDSKGNQLSDHYPLTVQFQYTKQNNVSLSSGFGGKGGIAFNYLANLPDSMPTKVSMRSASRVDGVSLTYGNGTVLSSGGTGGTESSMNLSKDEYLTQVTLCKGARNGNDRIFYAEFKTNKGNVLSGGQKTSDTTTLKAPSGWYIAGFFGRAESELDKLGVIYKPLQAK